MMTVEELAPIEGLNDTQGGFLRLLSAVTFASVVSSPSFIEKTLTLYLEA